MRQTVSALALSASGLIGIALWEGYTQEAVIPTQGDVPTVGFGSTTHIDGQPVKMGDRMTPVQALERKRLDLLRFEGAIKKCVFVPLHQYEYDAYVSLSYNIGSSAFCGSTLVRYLNQGDYAGACKQILRWKYYKGRDCSKPNRICYGLWKRRLKTYKTCTGQ